MIAWITRLGGRIVSARELKLGFSGGNLVFPDGRPFCLVCGRRPFKSRPVSAKDQDYAERQAGTVNAVLETLHPVLGGLNRLRVAAFSFEAPLCILHYWKGRYTQLATTVLFVLGLSAVAVLYFFDLLPAWIAKDGRALKGIALGIVVLGAFLFLRRSKVPDLLPCEIRRESKQTLILSYEREAPRPR